MPSFVPIYFFLPPPPLSLSLRIPDPEAVKPDDWDEDAPQKIPDPNAVKPEGWLDDGPETIPDPDASQPEDW